MSEEEIIKTLKSIADNTRKRLPNNIEVEHIYKGNISFKDALQGIIEDRLRERKLL